MQAMTVKKIAAIFPKMDWKLTENHPIMKCVKIVSFCILIVVQQPYDIFYTSSVSSPLHWHYYSEIIYIIKGSVVITCNNKKAILKEGDLCYIYPLQLNSFSKANDSQVQYAVLKFDIHTINIPQAYISKIYDIFIRRTQETDFCMIIENEQLNKEYIYSLIHHTIREYTEKMIFTLYRYRQIYIHC